MRKFAIIPLILVILAAGCGEEKKQLQTTAKQKVLIQWKGTPSGQGFTLGDSVLIAFESAGADQLQGPISVSIDNELLAEVTAGEPFSNPISTIQMSLGEHLIKILATKADGSKVAKNFIFELKSDVVATDYDFELLETLPHKRTSYTQGLEFYKGKLYEGTGLKGSSRLMEVNVQTGEPVREIELDKSYFGEGITILNDKIYQLTYQAQKCFVYDVNTFDKIDEFVYEMQEGWGLTNNGKELLMSDGTNTIYFIDPETFKVSRKIKVYNEEGDIQYLNELEIIDDTLYANVYQYDLIVQIDPATGKVLGHIYMDKLKNEFELSLDMDVLNGIAKKQGTEGIYVTGKRWPNMFRIKLKAREATS